MLGTIRQWVFFLYIIGYIIFFIITMKQYDKPNYSIIAFACIFYPIVALCYFAAMFVLYVVIPILPDKYAIPMRRGILGFDKEMGEKAKFGGK